MQAYIPNKKFMKYIIFLKKKFKNNILLAKKTLFILIKLSIDFVVKNILTMDFLNKNKI